MAYLYVQRPSAEAVMRSMADWVARLYGVKVTVHIENHLGENTTVIDGRPPQGVAEVQVSVVTI